MSLTAQTMELFLDRVPDRTAEATTESGATPDPILATLRVRMGLSGNPSVPVRQPQATIGSDPASDVVLDAPGVARRHGQLRLRGGVWSYVDFGSTAGSVVDGDPVHGEALLAPGSSLRLGAVELAFAPLDRWEDSPPERRAEDRAPLLLLPHDNRSIWPTVAFVLAIFGIFAAAFLLIRNH